jgi:hypothetical protein
MPIISFYQLLDTHISILPSSPDIARFQCALRKLASAGALKMPSHRLVISSGAKLCRTNERLQHF